MSSGRGSLEEEDGPSSSQGGNARAQPGLRARIWQNLKHCKAHVHAVRLLVGCWWLGGFFSLHRPHMHARTPAHTHTPTRQGSRAALSRVGLLHVLLGAAWACFDKHAGYWLGLDVPKYAWAIHAHEAQVRGVLHALSTTIQACAALVQQRATCAGTGACE